MVPLKFQPIFQHRIWGGQQLRALLNKPVPDDRARQPIGESWELADLPPGTVKADSSGANADGSFSSRITNGPYAGKTLHQAMRNPDFGFRKSDCFPLLIKFLDAQQDLSVQVHPDEIYCKNHPGSHLKSEAWIILHAQPGATIYKGLQPGTTREQFRTALEANAVEPLLHAIKVRAGDCHYLPSGTIHALGAGILAAEVQTPSDTTFRVFDWNRLTPDGKPRTLHIKEALECINFSAPQPPAPMPQPDNGGSRLVANEFFTIDRRQFPSSHQQPLPHDMAIWIILEGQGVICAGGHGNTAFTKGDTLLLPPTMHNAALKTIATCTLLEVKIPVRTKEA